MHETRTMAKQEGSKFRIISNSFAIKDEGIIWLRKVEFKLKWTALLVKLIEILEGISTSAASSILRIKWIFT